MERLKTFPDFSHELRQSDWLAGFIDGEGSFQIHRGPKGNHWPGLQVTQRDDDLVLMEQIAVALGGSVARIARSAASDPINGNPCVHVKVNSKASLLGVLPYLDAHPLRTKKAAEYIVWRGAVMAYVEEGGRSPVLPEAKYRLEGLRVYEEASV